MIQLRTVCKNYEIGGESIVGLENVSFELNRGDFVCLRGTSGSGKTTLLLTIGGMQRPTSGNVAIADCEDLYALNPAARSRVRAQQIGFIFQLFHLVPYLNVFDNIQLGAMSRAASREDADALIDKLGLSHRRRHKPSQLSVGECQRVAVARALIARPELILADEPTGNLDEENANLVMSILQEFCQGGGVLLLASHGEPSTARANRFLTIDSGVVQEQAAVV